MKALIVIDAQNEFSETGQRSVPGHGEILARIHWHVQRARESGESIAWVGDFTATSVPAMDGYGDPQVSWIVSAGGRRILHCGDTLWHGYWWRIGRQFGPLDAAFLPINGARFEWRKPWSDIPVEMTPEQAVASAIVTGANLIVPIHYGVVGAEGYREIPNCEQTLREVAEARNVNVQILRAGQWLSWPNREVRQSR